MWDPYDIGVPRVCCPLIMPEGGKFADCSIALKDHVRYTIPLTVILCHFKERNF